MTGLHIARAPGGVRTDIQGLRAIAVSLVLVFHLWPDSLGGGYIGVDVFFVISGFLITLHLITKPPRKGRDLGTFWARRIKRLLPASLLVLASVVIASRLVAPVTQWRNTAVEAITSALYVQNWRLAGTSVDYLAAERAPSPIQHFWSLSVEEQFYLVWPVLIFVLVWLAYKRGWPPMVSVAGGLSALVASSLAYSIYETATDPARAYFVTPTRMWELGVGGLLAVLVFSERYLLRRRPATVVAVLGLAAIAYTAVVYTPATPFPGYTALLPVLGTAAVILARPEEGFLGQVLALRPIQFLGDISYSVYLWHWPLIILLPFVSGDLGWLDKTSILVATLILAAATKQFVEDPARGVDARQLMPRIYQLGVAGMAVVVAISVVQIVAVDQRKAAAAERLEAVMAQDKPCFGAAAMAPGNNCDPTTEGPVVPEPAVAAEDKSVAYADNCWENPPFNGFTTCTYGDESSETQIALVGNSHAGHWLPALRELAEAYDWQITTYLASECSLTTAKLGFDRAGATQNCREWGQKVFEKTKGDQFDLVITSERNGNPIVGKSLDESYDGWVRGYLEYLKMWERTDTNVLVLRDNPLPGASLKDAPDCVAKNLDNLMECAGAKDVWLSGDALVDAVKKLDSNNITWADFTRYFCADDRCPSVIGGVVVYFDASHMTQTYARTMAPYLYPPVKEALER